MEKELSPVVEVIKDNCVNCRKCISVCPVRFCNDCSEGFMQINHNMCIGCGMCIDACSHDARIPVDDFDLFMKDLKSQKKVVAVVAPASASNFPDVYMNFNGWLKSIGVEALFDVSFGAELTVKTYIEHIKNNKPKTVIAQPCPAIVSFIEIYKPELIKYLAPADSPMLHTVKMVRKYYPKYRDHKIAVISPCIAKRREFDDTDPNCYNVTFKSLYNYFDKHNINLKDYPETDFDNPQAERAVLFSSPGGLLRTAEREVKGIREKTRKIEGVETIYEYLSKLPKIIENNMQPLLIDCLNCDMGCNGGPGTVNREKSIDEIEYYIEKRNKETREHYRKKNIIIKNSKASLNKLLDKYWESGLYKRKYTDISDNFHLKIPTEKELKEIYKSMQKFSDADIYNCSSCGYGKCEKMAIAIFNGLNEPKNCQFYNETIVELENNRKSTIANSIKSAVKKVDSNAQYISDMTSKLFELTKYIEKQFEVVNKSAELISHMINSINEVADETESQQKHSKKLVKITKIGGKRIKKTNHIIDNVSENAGGVINTIKVINTIAGKTDLLSMNASIEAAHAGEAGKGFMVVAEEIKELSESTSENAQVITKSLNNMVNKITKASKSSLATEDAFKYLYRKIHTVIKKLLEISNHVKGISNETSEISTSINSLQSVTDDIKSSSDEIKTDYKNIELTITELKDMTSKILAELDEIDNK